MNNQHDLSYKLLFSEPRVVRDLLTGFVKEEWIDRLDLDSLEKVSSTFVTDDLRDREGDVIWRVRFGDEWVYVYLLIEFQSTVDPFMALRIMTYVGLLYQELVKQKKLTQDGKLPPVLPIVLYNGEKRWNAALNVAELVQPVPGGLEHYRPDLPYLLLDEGAIVTSEQWSEETRNVVSAIFRLEHHRDQQDAIDLIGLLVQWLQAPEQTQLRRHFVLWIRRVLLPSWVPESEEAEWQSLNDLNEVHNMLAERAKKWPEQWKQEGLEEGRREGRQEGVVETRLETARNLVRETSLADEAIASTTGLSISEVAELRAELRH
ncbi:Rpn family recombination-promoting nuclease/putative transposase [Halomonas caseinilytica]|uniref:Rpn family recombination-promoting nuclease/putative transposase n=1 Tax=Halomonas caseinilytica TaxID=438744 RepID=UPI0008484EA2|nr:Rpn family recombination-promoting nuclease/putative transposase [Halomonas caseinilytica]